MDSPKYVEPNNEYSINKVTSAAKERPPQKPLEVDVIVEGKKLVMELDTGAALSLVSKETFTCLWPEHPLQETSTRLKMYSGEQLSAVSGGRGKSRGGI